jgi:hypothetical protein
MKLTKIIIAGTVLATSTVFAAPSQPVATGKLPAETVQGQVRYITGGIGHDEALAFRQAERHYPLGLEFAIKAKPRNEYAADVAVVIRDAKGKTVLDTVSSGPFLLAKLPAGRYDLKAKRDDKTLERHATVIDAKPTHVDFLWRSDGAGSSRSGVHTAASAKTAH